MEVHRYARESFQEADKFPLRGPGGVHPGPCRFTIRVPSTFHPVHITSTSQGDCRG